MHYTTHYTTYYTTVHKITLHAKLFSQERLCYLPLVTYITIMIKIKLNRETLISVADYIYRVELGSLP